jgi:hypothetical protein
VLKISCQYEYHPGISNQVCGESLEAAALEDAICFSAQPRKYPRVIKGLALCRPRQVIARAVARQGSREQNGVPEMAGASVSTCFRGLVMFLLSHIWPRDPICLRDSIWLRDHKTPDMANVTQNLNVRLPPLGVSCHGPMPPPSIARFTNCACVYGQLHPATIMIHRSTALFWGWPCA